MSTKKALVQIACVGITTFAVSLAKGGTIAYWPMVMDPATGGASRRIADASGNDLKLNVGRSYVAFVDSDREGYNTVS